MATHDAETIVASNNIVELVMAAPLRNNEVNALVT